MGKYKKEPDFVFALINPMRASTGRSTEKRTLKINANFKSPEMAPKTWFTGESFATLRTPSKSLAINIINKTTAIKTKKKVR